MSREFTNEECTQKFYDHLRGIFEYWEHAGLPGIKEKLSGAFFSTLVLFDGCSGMMPHFGIVPNPHPSDKPYSIEEGENYWPDPPEGALDTALRQSHELWHKEEKKSMVGLPVMIPGDMIPELMQQWRQRDQELSDGEERVYKFLLEVGKRRAAKERDNG